MTTDDKTIIFVCEHGAAKSVIAAAYFNRFAEQRGLNLRAAARGTNPDDRNYPKPDTISAPFLHPSSFIFRG
jgi:protein-tyrosine-phosphatase